MIGVDFRSLLNNLVAIPLAARVKTRSQKSSSLIAQGHMPKIAQFNDSILGIHHNLLRTDDFRSQILPPLAKHLDGAAIGTGPSKRIGNQVARR